MRECWRLLDLTSRSFSRVVRELEGELARVVSLADDIVANQSSFQVANDFAFTIDLRSACNISLSEHWIRSKTT